MALFVLSCAAGAGAAPGPRPEPTPAPEVEAVRATGPVTVDGHLDEAAWGGGEPYTRFFQRDPDEGEPASERTELRLLYDDAALYVGARLFDREPALVARRLSRRDEPSDADRFAILLDPRRDRLTGVRFEVSAAGVQRDQVIFNDTWTDSSWDAVWDSAVTVDAEGWTVEMRIPFSELRFMRGDHQTWGVNALRFIFRKNESDWLALVPKRESGLASRMATLTGLRGVEPRTPLVVVPYAAGSAESAPRDAADPFHDGTAWSGSAGVDLRRKIGTGFALDATVNPDFGQVEVDPAVVNLTAFETFFPERRPFFVEGAQIFDSFGRNGPNNYYAYNRSEPDLFYTRRIGRAPQGTVDAAWADAPRTTTILGAAKLTGKSANGWSVGVLEALTDREEAAFVDGDRRGRQGVEPLTNYFVARAFLDRERAGFGALVTSVARALEDDALAAALARSATVAGLDGYVYLDEDRDWVVAGRVAASRVGGRPEAIEALQLSSARYFQRPDRAAAVLDPDRTSLDGWTGSLDLNRQSGAVRVNASTWATSPGFDSNDLGFNTRSDRWGGHVAVQLQQPEPDGFTRFRALTFAKSYSWNFDGDKQADALNLGARLRFRNYWDLGLDGAYRWRGLDDRQTRGGPSMATGRSWNGGMWGGTDGRKPVVGRAHAFLFRNEWGSWQWETAASLEMRPSSALSLSVGPSVTRAYRVAQWVASQADAALAPDLGGHYVFAAFDQRELAFSLRLSWIFSPRLSLQMFAQPLLSRADYAGFKELARARSFDFVAYGPDEIQRDPATGEYAVEPGTGTETLSFADPDFSYKSLRVNTVLRWEWRPGSALYAVWTQARENSENPDDAAVGRSLDRLLASPATNVFEVKATFRLGD
jgi:hypothetical protein